MKKIFLLSISLLVSASSFAVSKKDHKISCINPKNKHTLEISLTYGEIVEKDKKGNEVANIDGTTARYSNVGTFTRVAELVYPEGDVAVRVVFGDISVQAYYGKQSFYCPRNSIQ